MSFIRSSILAPWKRTRQTPLRTVAIIPLNRKLAISTEAEAAAAPEGSGRLLSASEIHSHYRKELLDALGAPEFVSGHELGGWRKGREPKLVGILATKKEDAKAYAEVGRRGITLKVGAGQLMQ